MPDIVKKSAVEFNLLKDRDQKCEIASGDNAAKNSTIEIEGETYTLSRMNWTRLENMGFGLPMQGSIKVIMPGLVLKLRCRGRR
jgi:hypothetical protein